MAYWIDRTKCLCCHNCALECPVGAISYVGTGYSVSAAKCIGCGRCARVCNVGAAQPKEAAPAPAPHAPDTREADVVVLGAGAAGIVAAASAAQNGARVLVLEKAKKFGGSGWFAGFMAPAEPGKPAMPPIFEQAQQTLRERGVDPGIIELAKNTPYEFFQWLRALDPRVDEYWERMPSPFGADTYDLPGRKLFNLKCTDKAIGPGRSTSVMEKIVTDHFSELGVEILYEHEAAALQLDGAGAVCGVTAKNPGGELTVSCRAVICATGGFAHNDALLRKYAPHFFGEPGSEPTHRFAAPTNTGDIVALGRSAGAYLDYDNFFANVFGPVHHPFGFCLFQYGLQPEIIQVNRRGERFFDESQFGGGAGPITRQPGRVAWAIFDSAVKDEIADRISHGPDAALFPDIDAEFSEEEKLDTPVKTADTIEHLAAELGIPAPALRGTVDRYNHFCEQGRDDDFGKRPETLRPIKTGPFYAVFGKVATDGAFGGVLINAKTEVYRADKTGVIPGLFAAGDNAAGWALRAGEGEERLMVCNECNWAISSGFVAGHAAAEYSKA